LCSERICRSTPSIRYLIRRKFCSGSKWMSEALRSTASASSAEIRRTTGWLYSSPSEIEV
jgi:hypothetical protein